MRRFRWDIILHIYIPTQTSYRLRDDMLCMIAFEARRGIAPRYWRGRGRTPMEILDGCGWVLPWFCRVMKGRRAMVSFGR
jgi:hypothetical protein